MPSEKDKSVLKPYDYEIDGNSIRAFYDKNKKLVFVLDLTVDKFKPNVLLVMSSYGDRKWDDVLSNDYGMDLELVRPKKDNKYQKLDIQYDGLVVYDNLIRAYQDDGDIKSALQDLSDFRAMSVRRSAKERLETSTVIAEKTRETIERTSDTIVELRAKIKTVRSKITSLRRNVGKEPTKQSASKILKAEAQLDVLQGKLERAQKRLENANKRLLIAEDDITAARNVLDLVPDVGENAKFKTVESPVVAPAPVMRDDVEDEPDEDSEPDDDEYDDLWGDDDDDGDEENEDNNDHNDEVKPLFDKDPNILDENIAFKPINFDETPIQSSNTDEVKDTETEIEPISFTPPKPIMDVVQVPGVNESGEAKLDDVFADSIDDEVKYDFEPPKDEEQVIEEETETVSESVDDNVPVLDSLQSVNSEEDTAPVLEQDEHVTEIVAPDVPENPLSNTEIVDAAPMAKTGMAPAPTVSEQNIVRPVSAVRPPYAVTDIPETDNQQHKPNLLYYVLLLVLIALSIFTLWLYQRSNVSVDAVPELVSDDTPALVQSETPKAVEQKIDEPETDNTVISDDNPFITVDDDNTQTEMVSVEAANQDSVEENVNTEDEDVQPVDNSDDVNSLTGDDIEQSGETEEVSDDDTASELPVVNKPEYKVTTEKVFTADSTSESGIIGGNLCDGDVAPDSNGCCPGETYSTVDGQQVCCPDDGGDCFPPMF